MIRAFANILVDEGYSRSTMLDLQRESYQLIPKDLGRTIDHLRVHGQADLLQLDPDYRAFLQKHEVIFECDEQESQRFPELGLQWNSPSVVSNSIIELSGYDQEYHLGVEAILRASGCTRLLLVSGEPIATSVLSTVLDIYGTSILRSIDVISPFSAVDEQDIVTLVENQPRLRSWVLYGATVEKVHYSGVAGFGQVVSYPELPDIYSKDSYVDPAYFKSNITLYTESQVRHTYFNAKLFIRADGSMMNSPNSSEVLGNLKSLRLKALKEMMQSASLTKLWSVTKMKTDVCRDCEFRNMCVDSRPPIERAEGHWFHKSECNYNPYICKWKGEKGYRTLAECGVVSNAEGFSIDHERIATINAELWGE